MSAILKKVQAAALALRKRERAELVSVLLDSIDEINNQEEWDREWSAEAGRRRDRVRRSESKTIPGEQAMRELRRLL